MKPPSPTFDMPLAGSQCSPTAKVRMSTSASQNTGTEMPAKAKRLTQESTKPPGRSAETMPKTSDATTLSTKLEIISLQVCHKAGVSTSSTGCEWVREKPRSP